MRFSLAVVCVLMLGAAPAWACLETSLKSATELLKQVKPDADLAKVSGDIDTVAAACPADPFVLKVAAVTKRALANASAPAARAKLRGEAWTMWRKAGSARSAGQPDVMTVAGYGPIDFEDSYQLQRALINELLAEEQKAGAIVAEHAPFRSGDAIPDCVDDWDNVAAQVRLFVSDRGFVDAGLNFLNRAVAACEANIATKRDADILAARATVLMRGVEQGKAPAGALDQAFEDAARYVQIRGYSVVWWSEFDDKRLRDLAVAQAIKGDGVPETEWFALANLKKQTTYLAIALALDKAWAEAQAAGALATAYKSYRDVVFVQYNRAKADANADAARFALAQGAKMHATGVVRRPENRELPAPPAFLWNWIHADVKP